MAKPKILSKSGRSADISNDLTGINLVDAIKSKKIEGNKESGFEDDKSSSAMTSILDELDSILNLAPIPQKKAPVKKATTPKKTVSSSKTIEKTEKRDDALQTEINKLISEKEILQKQLKTFEEMKFDLEQKNKDILQAAKDLSKSQKDVEKQKISLEKVNLEKEKNNKLWSENENLYKSKLLESVKMIKKLQESGSSDDYLKQENEKLEQSNKDLENKYKELQKQSIANNDQNDDIKSLKEELEDTNLELDNANIQLENSKSIIELLKVHAGASIELTAVKEDKLRLESINSENSQLISALQANIKELQNSNESGGGEEAAELSRQNEELREMLSSKNSAIEEAIKEKIVKFEETSKAEIAKAKRKIFEDIVLQFLEPAALLESTILNSPDDPAIQSYLSGFDMISQMFYDLLISLGVESIDVKEGDVLNPDLMEAFGFMPGSGFPRDTVAKVMMKGFKKDGKVIKHTLVMVAE